MMITVLYGGEGPEREVSLRSGAAVTSAFAERGRDVTGTDILVGFSARALSPDCLFAPGGRIHLCPATLPLP